MPSCCLLGAARARCVRKPQMGRHVMIIELQHPLVDRQFLGTALKATQGKRELHEARQIIRVNVRGGASVPASCSVVAASSLNSSED
jgi:hypothetical protein